MRFKSGGAGVGAEAAASVDGSTAVSSATTFHPLADGAAQTSFASYPEMETDEEEILKSDASLLPSDEALRDTPAAFVLSVPGARNSAEAFPVIYDSVTGPGGNNVMDVWTPTGRTVRQDLSASSVESNNISCAGL